MKDIAKIWGCDVFTIFFFCNFLFVAHKNRGRWFCLHLNKIVHYIVIDIICIAYNVKYITIKYNVIVIRLLQYYRVTVVHWYARVLRIWRSEFESRCLQRHSWPVESACCSLFCCNNFYTKWIHKVRYHIDKMALVWDDL